MRIATLNCWGGRLFEDLMQFFEYHATGVDVWCLQEVPGGSRPERNAAESRDNLFAEIAQRLPEHTGFMHASHSGNYCGEPLQWETRVGMATFIRADLWPAYLGSRQLYENDSPRGLHPELKATGHLESLSVISPDLGQVIVANVHGVWERAGKVDTPVRLEQSRRIAAWLATQNSSPVVVAGDLNLDINQEAMLMLERAGLANPVRAFGIRSTRTRHYAPVYTTKPPYADYILTKGMRALDCRVLPEVVSDHACVFAELRIS